MGMLTPYCSSAANTYQDALAQFRVANGQRAASLNLGVRVSFLNFDFPFMINTANRSAILSFSRMQTD